MTLSDCCDERPFSYREGGKKCVIKHITYLGAQVVREVLQLDVFNTDEGSYTEPGKDSCTHLTNHTFSTWSYSYSTLCPDL